ncbi:23593_t:CDS:2 [Racocetra persica]|uniref:23593_t:CDS:1 n=1 Tax=Racocetra persica TaxID=160502 RepID=A0ACA9MP10_9GLOM|nr:23593_t:CDS:2 [Racocetra persica]
MAKKYDIASKPDVREYIRFLNFRKVNKSLAYLKSSFKELDIMVKQNKPNGIYAGIHPRFNKIIVIVSLPPDQRIQAFIEAARQYDADVYFDLSPTITSTYIKRNKMSCIGGDSGGPVFSFSDFSDLGLVTIHGIVVLSADNAISPFYPFSIILPREIILKSANLEFITKF